MAAVKARRSGPVPVSPKGKPQPFRGPRLAAMKAGGRDLARSLKQAPDARGLGAAAAGALLMLGAAVAGAAWIGGSLFDMREAIGGAADAAASHAGLRVTSIDVQGVSGAREAEVKANVLPKGRYSMLAVDPLEVKARLESLHWVQSASVRRLWPSTLQVKVDRREAYALWQRGGVATVVDAHGRPAPDAQLGDYAHLPVLVGADALGASEPILVALEEAPAVRERAYALVRVGGRRWDIEMRSGMRILLPEHRAERALARLEGLHSLHGLLDRPLERLDMRNTGELVGLPGRKPASGQPRLARIDRRLAQGA